MNSRHVFIEMCSAGCAQKSANRTMTRKESDELKEVLLLKGRSVVGESEGLKITAALLLNWLSANPSENSGPPRKPHMY